MLKRGENASGGGGNAVYAESTYTSGATTKYTLGFKPKNLIVYYWSSAGAMVFDYSNNNGVEKLYLTQGVDVFHNDRTSAALGVRVIINNDGFTLSGLNASTAKPQIYYLATD